MLIFKNILIYCIENHYFFQVFLNEFYTNICHFPKKMLQWYQDTINMGRGHKMDYYTELPYNKINPFSIVSMFCGLLSVTLCCTGILSIPFGALGILFAVLTKRLGKPMPPMSVTGTLLSCLGMVLGICMCVYSFIYVMNNSPEMWNALLEYYRQY